VGERGGALWEGGLFIQAAQPACQPVQLRDPLKLDSQCLSCGAFQFIWYEAIFHELKSHGSSVKFALNLLKTRSVCVRVCHM
jgi:hypothetical protein